MDIETNSRNHKNKEKEQKSAPGRQKGAKNSPLVRCLVCAGERSKSGSSFACKKCLDVLERRNLLNKPKEPIPFRIFDDHNSNDGIN